MRLEDEIKYSELDWECIWQKSLKKGFKKEKDWDKIATEYGKWLENDDYPDVLLNEMKLSSNDTVLDIGCAEGTITRKIAKKAKSITGIDKSKLMLEELNRKAADEGLSNVKTIQKDINSQHMQHGGLDKLLLVLLQTKQEPFVFQSTWLKQSTK